MPWYKLVNCGVIVVVCGGCQEVVDMYFHTQLGARREPPADTNASCQALLSAGLDFQKIIICVIKIIINNIFVINMIIIFSSKASTEQALFKLKSVEFWKKSIFITTAFLLFIIFCFDLNFGPMVVGDKLQA